MSLFSKTLELFDSVVQTMHSELANVLMMISFQRRERGDGMADIEQGTVVIEQESVMRRD